ncbi:hypothetical protein LMG2828_00300 [Achromobacter piechaudii]|jgi:hypothetical protein|uniref:hypothetical protein n=1 Tax=Achromobacter TaxID=222 RepID=UPI000F8FBD11|nr:MULTISPECIES: hypothetical protein [Achromobacter]AZS77419.1 hypothetical protein ELS24_02555 [Achromobacter spanius]CAB3817886.1 hypothetical protein LMG2828_00300 [Achromobacter piechaudii]
MFLPPTRGKSGALLALLFALLLPTGGHASTANQADVQLQTDLNTMVVRVDQSAPMPPGGCAGGYSWHTTYGGCRVPQTQTEYSQCPAGYTGSQVRYRTYYVLQANASDVAYEGWGPWQDGCTASRAGGVLDVVIAKARGNETGETFPNSLGGAIAAQMQVNYGTMFGATIYRPTAELNCIFASGTTSGDTSRAWMGQLMPPGASVNKGASGHCELSNGNRTATLFGSCDTGSGGDADICQSATRIVNITSVSGCTVTTETRLRGQLIDVGNYGICN